MPAADAGALQAAEGRVAVRTTVDIDGRKRFRGGFPGQVERSRRAGDR